MSHSSSVKLASPQSFDLGASDSPSPPTCLIYPNFKVWFLLKLKTAHGRHFLWSHDLTLVFHIHTFFGNSTQGSNFKQNNSPQANQNGLLAVHHRSQLFLLMGWTLSRTCEEKVFIQPQETTKQMTLGTTSGYPPTQWLLHMSKRTSQSPLLFLPLRVTWQWLLTCPWWGKTAK